MSYKLSSFSLDSILLIHWFSDYFFPAVYPCPDSLNVLTFITESNWHIDFSLHGGWEYFFQPDCTFLFVTMVLFLGGLFAFCYHPKEMPFINIDASPLALQCTISVPHQVFVNIPRHLNPESGWLCCSLRNLFFLADGRRNRQHGTQRRWLW